jgi:tryptophan synthase beta chain
MGLFNAFLDDKEVGMYGVEPSGLSLNEGEHAATLTLGKPGVMHGFKSYMLQDDEGNPLRVYSVASGLDYPSVGPQHSFLKDIKRVEYVTVNDKETIDAFFELSRVEGLIPALESAHAVAFAMKLASTLPQTTTLLVNLSGRGDKDIEFVVNKYGKEYGL